MKKTLLAIVAIALLAACGGETQRLREECDSLRSECDSLRLECEALQVECDSLYEIQNGKESEAWVLICDEDRLDDLDLIWRGKLKMKNMRKSYCRQIDRRYDTQFSFKAREPQVLTAHPYGTYSLRGGRSGNWTLTITDVEKFWSRSKYLIVQTED